MQSETAYSAYSSKLIMQTMILIAMDYKIVCASARAVAAAAQILAPYPFVHKLAARDKRDRAGHNVDRKDRRLSSSATFFFNVMNTLRPH